MKLYEEFTQEFKKRMLAKEEIVKLYDKIILLFNSMNIDDISYQSHKTVYEDIISNFYLLDPNDYKNVGIITLTLTTGMISGDHGVTIKMEISLVQYNQKYHNALNKFESFLHFLASIFDPGEKDKYFDEFTDNVNIDELKSIISKINVENYEIWSDTSKYNL